MELESGVKWSGVEWSGVGVKNNKSLTKITPPQTTTTLVSLFEPPPPSSLLPLSLNFVSKCNPSDPYPLMPSCVPPLHLTRFAEPTRDRDKEWRLVSQREVSE